MRRMLGGQFKSIIKGKRGYNVQRRVGPSNNCRTKNWQDFLLEDDNKPFHYLSNCSVSCKLRNNNHRLRSVVARVECVNTLERTLHFTGEAQS